MPKRTASTKKAKPLKTPIDKRLTETEKKAIFLLIDSLGQYADPEFYHAIAFMADRPAGGFADDFDEEHGDDFYDRPMPGKLARNTLIKVRNLMKGVDNDEKDKDQRT